MKLTNEIRDYIVVQACARTFDARREALEVARGKFADVLYYHAFGKEAEIARTMPSGWIKYGRDLYIDAPGWGKARTNADYKTPTLNRHLLLSVDQPFPIDAKVVIAKGHAFAAEAAKLLKEHWSIIDAETALRTKLRALLRSVNTDKRLNEVWPEGATFMPPQAKTFYAPVPVTLTHEINRMLGLEPSPDPAKKAITKAMSKKTAKH